VGEKLEKISSIQRKKSPVRHVEETKFPKHSGFFCSKTASFIISRTSNMDLLTVHLP